MLLISLVKTIQQTYLKKLQIAQNLEGVVSKDTQLSSLSIVEDVQEEKKKSSRKMKLLKNLLLIKGCSNNR